MVYVLRRYVDMPERCAHLPLGLFEETSLYERRTRETMKFPKKLKVYDRLTCQGGRMVVLKILFSKKMVSPRPCVV